ncbi:uncharacterized protein LOC121981805 isoform X1 [Zingiber officinale]|uniref:uncharacterized protein LOC121981805 isoform X1 n=1 Tax=Zingiber officinale TaxID=94328 RepID=UPI001C4C76FD|nr:uncharacterized protein LOC121981805 isoform X1 [Zingiber officinale]
MNTVARAVLAGHRPSPFSPNSVSFFHSTPVLERKWRNYGHSRFDYYANQKRYMESKRKVVSNLSEYAEYLIQKWRAEDEDSFHETPWFRKHFWATEARKNGFREPHQGSYRNKRNGTFDFCSSDDDDVETIFRSSFGRARFSYRSFYRSENFQWSYSGDDSHKSSRNWTYETEDEIDASYQQSFAGERLALGLKATGPLKLEEVKTAYRSCALKWHPDRHQGSSKIAAEEKFKHCTAAYQTLCDKLAMN